MMWTVVRDGHLFVYWRGELIYKRWDGGYAVLFDPYGSPRWMKE